MNLLPVYIFCKTTPIQKDFFLDHYSPGFSYSYCTYWVFWEILFLKKAVSVRGLNSILTCQIAIKLVSFRQCFLPVFIFQTIFARPWMSVCSHSEKPSHTLSGTVRHGEKAWGKRWISWTQVCRRFTRVNVTKQTVKLHHEIYLTPSLESVLQAWTKVRLMLLSPSTMKYLPDGNLFFSLAKPWH